MFTTESYLFEDPREILQFTPIIRVNFREMAFTIVTHSTPFHRSFLFDNAKKLRISPQGSLVLNIIIEYLLNPFGL